MPTKLILCVVDALKSEMLVEAVEAGAAPTFGSLLERGVFVPDCVSAFPSVTPVCSASIVTGRTPDVHGIPAMNWYHRAERRYVEYGSSFEATRAFGLFRTLYDTVYNMNLAHLNPAIPTVFELLEDAGMRTACTPFLIYRGRTRHELGLEGLLRRVALAADFRHAVWGPNELFYGELYASRRVPCRPTLARPGTRDVYSACVARELIERDLFDFMLFSLPDNDHHSHRFGPGAQVESIAHADAQLRTLVDAGGGMDAFLLDHAVIVMADHSQSDVGRELPLARMLDGESKVLGPVPDGTTAELAVCPTSRAGGVYVLSEGERRLRTHKRVRETLVDGKGVELVAWLEDGDGTPCSPAEANSGAEAVIRSGSAELRFRPGGEVTDRRSGAWQLEGDLAVLDGRIEDGRFESANFPAALGRLWSALRIPNAADLLVSAAPGYELVDWGGITHTPGGSHGSLRAGDSLAPLLFVGCGPDSPDRPEGWALEDVAPVILEHFGVATA